MELFFKSFFFYHFLYLFALPNWLVNTCGVELFLPEKAINDMTRMILNLILLAWI